MNIFKKGLFGLVSAISLMGVSSTAQAHFQLVYTPEVNIEKPGKIPFRIIFWHPMENGFVMDMGKPQEFFYIFKSEKTDLLSSLKPITFTGKDSKAAAFETEIDIKRNGDYIVGLVPEPYYEKSEDKYIQQLTKSFLNKGGVPSDWNEPVGMKTEIIPLNKPTNILTGSTFSGVVLSEGKPVAGAEIEIEYMSAEPDLKTNTPQEAKAEPAVGGTIVAITDENGVFTFGIPKSGFWGFAALGVGPDKTYKEKELSQDAVIWIYASDLK